MGCSIGGRIVLHLAYEHPERFRALIGLESAAYAEAYYDLSWLNRPDVHGGMVCAGVISGLVAPTVAPAERWETLWHYMQSGPGVFAGDLYFYTTADGDIRHKLGQIDITRCPLYLLTGEYDYSCTAEGTLGDRRAHRRAGHRHEGARAFSDERGPREVRVVSLAGAGEIKGCNMSCRLSRRKRAWEPKTGCPHAGHDGSTTAVTTASARSASAS